MNTNLESVLAEHASLRQIIEKQQTQIAEQAEIIEKQAKLIAELRAEICDLKEQIATLEEKLHTNSRNSSLPPSQDPFRPKSPRPPSGKKQGGQPGHFPSFRQLLGEDKVSSFVPLYPAICSCGNTLSPEDVVKVEKRQQVELSSIEPFITQYDIYTCRCSRCKKLVKAEAPPESKEAFGPSLKAFIVFSTVELHATERKIQRLVKQLGFLISLGSISNLHQSCSKALETSCEEIRKEVLAQPTLHADETTWRCKGKHNYAWIATTASGGFIQINNRRTSQAFIEIFHGCTSILVTDRYAGYNQHTGLRQLCHQHIQRDFKKIAEREGADKELGLQLLLTNKHLFSLWHEFKEGKIDRLQLTGRIHKEVRIPLAAYLCYGAFDSQYHAKTTGTCKQLLKNFDKLWTFVTQEGVEPTNNLAELDLRFLVIMRKISLGSQSNWGNRFYERVCSVWLTLKKLGRNFLDYMYQVFSYYARGDPIPSIY